MQFNTAEIKNSYQRREYSSPIMQAVLLGIILVIFSWFVIKPKLNTLSITKSDLRTAQDKLKQTQADEASLNQLITKLHASKDEVALVDEALPLTGRVSKADVLIESLVQTSGMSLNQLSADDNQKRISAGDKSNLGDKFKEKRVLHTTTMNVAVTGTMDQFKNLLELMETSGRIIDIDSLDIVGGDSTVKFHLVLKIYAYEAGAQGATNAN